MSHVSVGRRGWLPLPLPGAKPASSQLPLALPEPVGDRPQEDWARLETDVVGGVFCPPLRDERAAQRQHYPGRPRNRQLHEERVPASLFGRDGTTYRTTASRLWSRGHFFNVLITVCDGDLEIPFRLFQVVRRGDAWTRMRFRHLVGGTVLHELVVLNAEVDDSAAAPERGIAVVRDGDWWVARFAWSEENVDRVRDAGFRYSPVEKWWYTTDPEVTRRLEAAIGGAPEPEKVSARRPIIRLWR